MVLLLSRMEIKFKLRGRKAHAGTTFFMIFQEKI